MSQLELTAVTLGLIFVVLAIAERRSCWLAAIASAVLYIKVFLDSRLYTESALQIFLIGVYYYGWKNWQVEKSSAVIKIQTISPKKHLSLVVPTALVAGALGLLLATYTNASFPFTDSQITCFTILVTYLQAKKILECWVYWVVIDLVAIGVYLARDLYLTAGLYGVYVGLALLGLKQWREAMK